MKKIKWVVPTFYIIFLMLPIYWLLNMSFKSTTEIINVYSLWPQDFTLDNYKTIFTDSTWYMGYVNSIMYTVLNTIISVSVALPAAYAFSRYKFLGDKHLFFWLLTNRMAPPAAIVGIKILKKNLGKEYPSTYAVSSNSLGTADINPSNIQTARGILKRQ